LPHTFHKNNICYTGAVQYNIETTTPERLLHCCKLLLYKTVASANPTLRLHTKDAPSHRRFYTDTLNGIDLKKGGGEEKKLNSFPRISICCIPHNSICIILLLVTFSLDTCCISNHF